MVGFTYGYRRLLLNMLCRLRQLAVEDYVVIAFDPEAYRFCIREHGGEFPCLPANADVAWPAESASFPRTIGSGPPFAYDFGTQEFKHVTKLKSQQVLRALRAGYSVLWSDVDVYWFENPFERIHKAMVEDGAQIAIQSDAPFNETRRNIDANSGFYYVAQSASTVMAFQNIVRHALTRPNSSEQPSFNSILCGSEREYSVDDMHCHNKVLSVRTLFLNRLEYINGATEAQASTLDNASIVHFNYRISEAVKTRSLVNRGVWVLEESTDKCLV